MRTAPLMLVASFAVACPSAKKDPEPPPAETCASAAAAGASVGCEFWAVDLDQADDLEHEPFAIAIANPAGVTAHVDVEDLGTTYTLEVGPGAAAVIRPQEVGFGDHSIEASGITPAAYRITSDRPIAAWQWNPENAVTAGSSDGSLLLPAAGYGTTYYGVTRPTASGLAGYLSIVAREPTTTVTVTPTADVASGSGVPAISASTPWSFPLDAFDVLTLEAVEGGDLTGTLVTADKPIALFGGHEAAMVPESASYADHLEEQLPPVAALGKTHPILRSHPRYGAGIESEWVRIVAVASGTALTYDPATSGACATLSEGLYCEFSLVADVLVMSTQPVLVTRALVGGGSVMSEPTGDPALGLVVPAERYLTSYALVVPSGYATTELGVVAHAGSAVSLDGASVASSLVAPIGTGFVAGRISVTPGFHRVACPAGCGVEIHALGSDVASVFPAGMSLVPAP